MVIRSAQPASSKFLHFSTMIIAIVSFLQFSTPSYARDVTLAWDHSISKNVVGYLIYYRKGTKCGPPYDGKDAREGKSPIKIRKIDTYTLTNLSDSGNYFFAVKAYDSAGTESPDYSNVVCTDRKVCDKCTESEQPTSKEPIKPAAATALSAKVLTEPEKTAEKQLTPEELAVVAPVTSPSGEAIKLSREQVEIVKKQTGVFYGAEAADMLGPGEVVVALPGELGGGYLYGKPEHLARAFAAAGATVGSVPATHLFVKRSSCLGF